jgi:hypothetical protein
MQNKIYNYLEDTHLVKVDSLGASTKRKLERLGVTEPKYQGFFQVNAKTRIGIPVHIQDIEAWKEKMLIKYEKHGRSF